MEGQFQTSFIPKRPVSQSSGPLPRRGLNVPMIVSVALLLLSIVLAVYVFAEEHYVESHTASVSAGINTAIQSLQPSVVANLSALDSRIEDVKTLLNQHVALSGFFNVLESGTLKSIQFTGFKYTVVNDGGPQKITVSLTGKANSFASVALQSDTFNSSQYAPYIIDPAFSNFSLDTDGNILFLFTATINPAMYLYASNSENNIQSLAPSNAAAASAPASTTPSTGSSTPQT